jgi:hypothetical protein
MRVATFTLPVNANDGADLRDVHFALRSAAIATFGGFTAIATEGGWQDDATGKQYVEPGILYQFAMPDDAASREKLESFARFYGHMADQVCVMVAHADGAVAFVECFTAEHATA